MDRLTRVDAQPPHDDLASISVAQTAPPEEPAQERLSRHRGRAGGPGRSRIGSSLFWSLMLKKISVSVPLPSYSSAIARAPLSARSC